MNNSSTSCDFVRSAERMRTLMRNDVAARSKVVDARTAVTPENVDLQTDLVVMKRALDTANAKIVGLELEIRGLREQLRDVADTSAHILAMG